ncbi:MAG: hypothetical protein AAB316_07610, partial [Bacteroidota bacterium]
MKLISARAFLAILLVVPAFAFAQNCEALIAEDKTIGGAHILKTAAQTFVVRGNYTYSMDFRNDEAGIVAKVYSKAGELFNQNDELIFVDMNGTRRSYRFIEMGEMVKEGGTPIHQNTMKLDLAAIEWFAGSIIREIFIKNNVKNQMLKFTITPNRQTEFQAMAHCFNQKLNKSLVNDTPLGGNPNTGGSEPVSKTNTPQTKRVADISQLNDQELADLYEQLRQTKERVKTEIAAENDRLEKFKSQMQEEMAAERAKVNEEKTKYAQEVLEARKRSQEEIAAAQKESATGVVEAREKASTEVQKITSDVAEARTKAAEEIQKSKLEAAQQVAAARENAAQEIKRIKDNMEQAKIQYADEIASARETSASEILRIRDEAGKQVETARTQAKSEQERTTGEVVETKRTASEEILKTKEETAAEIARVREQAVHEKEKAAFEVAEARRKAAEEKSLLQQKSASEMAEITENVARQKETSA